MSGALIFALTLLLAILLSGLARKSMLSTAVLFLVVGFLSGKGGLNILSVSAEDSLVQRFIEIALFSVLFLEGLEVDLEKLASNWKLPARALLLGMPLTLLGGALLARYLVGLSWGHALIVGAVLSPTDPVFAAAIIGKKSVPLRLRRLLKIESGLNDGLALPFVLLTFALASGEKLLYSDVLLEVAFGIVLGIAVPWCIHLLVRIPAFQVRESYKPLASFAVGLLVLALSDFLHANEFLAAFAAGITMARLDPDLRDAFKQFGTLTTELLKVGGLLIFGALLSTSFLVEHGAQGYIFVALILVVVRPLALSLSFLGTSLTLREWVTAVWFGPRGFASVFYGLLLLHSPVKNTTGTFQLIALTIVVSIIAHSSSDTLIAKWFENAQRSSPLEEMTAKMARHNYSPIHMAMKESGSAIPEEE